MNITLENAPELGNQNGVKSDGIKKALIDVERLSKGIDINLYTKYNKRLSNFGNATTPQNDTMVIPASTNANFAKFICFELNVEQFHDKKILLETFFDIDKAATTNFIFQFRLEYNTLSSATLQILENLTYTNDNNTLKVGKELLVPDTYKNVYITLTLNNSYNVGTESTFVNTDNVLTLIEDTTKKQLENLNVTFENQKIQDAFNFSLKKKLSLSLYADLLKIPSIEAKAANINAVTSEPILKGNYNLQIPANETVGYNIVALLDYDVTSLKDKLVNFISYLGTDSLDTWNFIDRIVIGYYNGTTATPLKTFDETSYNWGKNLDYLIDESIFILENYDRIYIAYYTESANTFTRNVASEIKIKHSYLNVVDLLNEQKNSFLLTFKEYERVNGGSDFGDPRSYGAKFDGVTDDAAAINACLLENKRVKIPDDTTVIVGSPILVNSGNWIEQGHLTKIKLANGANCPLIKNRWAEQAYFMDKNLIDGDLPSFMATLYPDYGATFPSPNYVLGEADKYIKITGGTWDGNGANQIRQDYRYGSVGYYGDMMRIVNAEFFVLENTKLYDSCSYLASFAKIKNFIIKDVELNYQNARVNLDGLHFEGDIYNGVIENIFGRTNDDMVTFNGGDRWIPKATNGNAVTTEANRIWYPLCQGRIENIYVKNIHATGGFRATRLLSNTKVPGLSPANETEGMANMVFDGIFGTYTVDVISITSHLGDEPKTYDNLVFKNINGKSTGINHIAIENNVEIKSLVIDGISYYPTNSTKELLQNSADIKSLAIYNLSLNGDGTDLSAERFIQNNPAGTITKLKILNLVDNNSTYGGIINDATVVEKLFSDL